jgi:hypothetical protein
MSRELLGLVESSRTTTTAVKRYGDGHVDVGEELMIPFAHARGERTAERPALIVFERVHDRAEGPVVGANRSRDRNL